jgi:hypothetical protein
LALGLILSLAGCSSERHFARDMAWPFGNPNAPPINSETAERAIGKTPDIAPIVPQAGDVWPGAVQPMPTLSDIQKNSNLPLGQAYTPSLPSPYPPGQGPDQGDQTTVPPADGNLYAVPPGAVPQTVPGN